MVLAHGNAPRSIGYQPIALLLSYTRKTRRRAEDLRLNRQGRSSCFRNSAHTSAGSLSKVAESSGPAPQASRPETASNRSPHFAVLLSENRAEARGHAPQRRVAAQSASNGCRRLVRFRLRSPRGRICTCVDPLRRRRPELLGHAEKLDLAAGLPPTTQRSKRCMIVISPREGKWSSRRELHPEPGLRRAV